MNLEVQDRARAAGAEALTLRYRVDDALLHEAMVATGRALMRRRPAGGKTSGWRAVGLVLAILVGIAAVVDLLRYAGVGVELLYLLIGLGAGFAIYSHFHDRGYRRIARLMAENPAYSGELTARLDRDGIEIRGGASLSRLDWRAVDDVLVLDSGAVALVVPTEMVPLPVEALPDGLTRAELIARIEAWRQAATA